MGKVTLAFKSGDRDNLNNYRPISVLPTVARVLKKISVDKFMIILRQITYWEISNLDSEPCIQLH